MAQDLGIPVGHHPGRHVDLCHDIPCQVPDKPAEKAAAAAK
jgi:hypothetical protein